MNDTHAPTPAANPADAKRRDYRDTVFLPTTSFPMRGDLPKREPAMLVRWADMDLTARLREAGRGKPRFELHDGPIYSRTAICISATR